MKRKRPVGFALVEVVLALAVAAIALTAVLALSSVGLNSSRESTQDTLLSEMASDIMGRLKAADFTELMQSYGGSTVQENVTTLNTFPLTPLYYDGSGRRIEDAANLSEAIYRCAVTAQGDPATLGIPREDPANPTGPRIKDMNLLLITLQFEWPVQASQPNSNVIHGTVARY